MGPRKFKKAGEKAKAGMEDEKNQMEFKAIGAEKIQANKEKEGS